MTYNSKTADRYLEAMRKFAEVHYKGKKRFSFKEICEMIKIKKRVI